MNKNIKKIIYKLFVIIILLAVLFWFYKINENNYQKHREIIKNYVNHPDDIMTPEFAEKTSFGFANLRADLYWLQTIQYIGWNAVSSEYKKYLYAITDLVTHLNPHFERPYIIAQLLLPDHNPRYENLSENQQDKHILESVEISKKWIQNFCDIQKVEAIKKENNLQEITQNPKYINPCKSYKIPYYLAYIYYFYLDDPESSSLYYKVAAANHDTVEWAKTMAAIMAGKSWDREKSIFMFLNIAQSLDVENGVCSDFSKQLNNVAHGVFTSKEIPLSGKLVKDIEDARNYLFGKFEWSSDSQQLSDTSCMNFLNKANREINIAYIQNAEDRYFQNTQKHTKNAQELFDKWYIDFLPTDFQQYEDYGIRYVFNNETWKYDYNMQY